MKKIAKTIYDYVINPAEDEDLAKAWQQSGESLPVIWLLGKTGAGKSTLVQQITGESAAQVGTGFKPCTSDATQYNYPSEHPIMRFLDTRGFGEADYDPTQDLTALGEEAHAALFVIRLRDAEQSALLDALSRVRKTGRYIRPKSALVVYTGADEVADAREQQRAIAVHQKLLEKAWGHELDHCIVAFPSRKSIAENCATGEDVLRDMISSRLPELRLWLQAQGHEDAERANFDRLSSEVLWYAGAAAASDALPLVGLVSVPAIQGKMLHSLAGQYGIEWDGQTFSEFIAALGSGFALSYATSLGARQLAKLIPGYGQIAGTAFAVTVSYGITYGLGRAACSYLYHKKTGKTLDPGTLKKIYNQASEDGKAASADTREHQQS